MRDIKTDSGCRAGDGDPRRKKVDSEVSKGAYGSRTAVLSLK